jgi:hypothetical protein
MPEFLIPDTFGNPEYATAQDCRLWERTACDEPAQCLSAAALADKDCGWSAKVHNVSAGGVGLYVGRRFEPGTLLFIALRRLPERRPLAARVAHATRLPSGGWLVGCEFPRCLDEETLRDLLQSPAAEE